MHLPENVILGYHFQMTNSISTQGWGQGKEEGSVRKKKKIQQFSHAINAHISSCTWCVDRCQSLGKIPILNNHNTPNQTETVAQLKYTCYSSPHNIWSCRKVEFGSMSDKN